MDERPTVDVAAPADPGTGPAPLHDDAHPAEAHAPSEHRLRVAFAVVSALALAAFLTAQVVLGARADSPEGKVKALMPQIRAELVDTPMSTAQASWPLEAQDGTTFTLGTLPRDTLVFLNFWATWCPPCREELPSMRRLREAMKDRRFAMVAVSYDESWGDITDFFTRWLGKTPDPRQMLVVRDPKTDPGQSLRETFGTNELPDTYVVMNGHVLARFVNTRNWVDPAILDYFRALAPEL